MISLTDFLAAADAIAAEEPSYRLGHDGTDGKCDCIGYIIGSIRRGGGSWNGIHGSNYAARNEMSYLLPVADVNDLIAGEVVCKAAKPGQSNYSLPSRYKDAPDQLDYFHIGIVRSTDPLRIVHCTTTGVTTDTKLGQWTHRGWLRKVSREADAPMSEIITATVAAEKGSTVNLRSKPHGRLISRIPVGATVILSGRQEIWRMVTHNGHTGWMMDRYLCADSKEE